MQENERIGQYEIVEQIGKGGMATVYKAYHERLDRHVAIKIMHTAFLTDENFLARFQREARIVAKLEHPNIVPIYDYAEKDNNPYLVMRLIEGMTLKQKAIKSGLTFDEVVVIMRQVADALDYAHGLGVLHRDMKPSNILIDADGKPYITDFGLARMAQVGESTISHDMMLGTPFYISPEQAQGVRDLSPATDIYSLAVILYELVTGSTPFVAESAYAIVHGHIYKQATPPSQINPDLDVRADRVFERALAKAPTERYPTAKALIDAFTEAVAEPPKATVSAHAAPVAPKKQSIPVPTNDEKGKRFQVEAKLDLDNISWSEVGQRLKTGVVSIAERIEEVVDSELKKRGMGSEDPTEIIRRRVEKRHKERQGFIGHLSAYIMVNLMMLTFFWIVTKSFPVWMLWVIGGWGIGVMSHYYEYYSKYGAGADKKRRELRREIEQELGYTPTDLELLQMDEVGLKDRRKSSKSSAKNKRTVSLDSLVEAPPVRLTEDGELTDSFIQEKEEPRQSRRRK